ncbi:MAG: ABC-ATPase domain-containing protein, partial [Thermodesulfobacteriota bacterium]
MKPYLELKEYLQNIDGKGYKFYKEVEGEYDFGE